MRLTLTYFIEQITTSHEALQLFEAKLSKGARLIWEPAIGFSPRLTQQSGSQPSEKVYSYVELIRVWDIVTDHDKVTVNMKGNKYFKTEVVLMVVLVVVVVAADSHMLIIDICILFK